jgi:hypothetical protein
MPDGKPSVLASLTASVMEEKTKASKPSLTPVAGEGRALKPQLPNDTGLFMSNERLADHAKELRKFASEAIAIADGLDAMLNTEPEVKPVDLDAVRKEKEREADARAALAQPTNDFEADLAAKAEAAQAAVFKPASPKPGEWVCPAHGKAAIEKTSQRTGRTYLGCPDCNLFPR